LKKLPAICLAVSIGFAPIVLAPMAATAQPPPPIRAGKIGVVKPATVIPAATAKARECSREADAKGLRAKPRKKFIAECKKA
jgi:hypothetical protein